MASCSAATVSRVLNTPELVSPDTAERVRKAVAELGYRPNPFAKGLMTRTSKMFALLLPKEAADLHVEVVRAAEAAAEFVGPPNPDAAPTASGKIGARVTTLGTATLLAAPERPGTPARRTVLLLVPHLGGAAFPVDPAAEPMKPSRP